MNKDFENEIRAIAQSNKDRDKEPSEVVKAHANDKNYTEVLEKLFSISEKAVNIYNSSSDEEDLSVYKLPIEFLEIFLEIPGRRGGFCIISPTKLVIFFDEDPDLITVIGKIRNLNKNRNNTTSKATQLLKVSFSNKSGKYEYKDNTGGKLNPYDIVSLLIRWVSS
ncbi:MAG: hypothetical protein IH964_12440 [Candidatus Dadabacteria bacterium]|nr:hypothetical protein [Candidatus Dadabacteria bacterium]